MNRRGMARRNGRWWALIGMVVVLVSGCAGGVDPQMDHEQARREVADIFDTVQATVGGDWENLDRGAEDCRLPSGRTGAKYALARFGPGVVDESERQRILNEITAQWTTLGFEPVTVETGFTTADGTEVTATELRYPASGYDANGMFMVFGINENATDLLGYTRCVPGDSIEINKQWWEDYNRQQEELGNQ